MSEQIIASYRHRVESALERYLPTADTPPQRLHQAMRYAVLNGGKRIRAVLVYAAGQAVGASLENLDVPASAIEMMHAYSLVHDDLPAMDDDDLRRGKPSCHIAYDEATAILVGDALQAQAFYLLAQAPDFVIVAESRLQIIYSLAAAVGSQGMVGGQAIDLAAVGNHLTLEQMETMHLYKTGALIRACLKIAVLAQAAADQTTIERLDRYGRCIGLAFQIRDDILDVTADTETLGKPRGADIALNKPTYPTLLGLEQARSYARQLGQQAKQCLADFDDGADTLRWLADYIVHREY